MEYPIKRSFYKLLGFTFIVSVIYLSFITLIQTFSKNSDTQKNLLKYIDSEDTSPKVVFVGSSRVQRGFDPALLKRQVPEFNYYNMGLSGASILYNYELTEKLITVLPEKSTVFFELSDLTTTLPIHYLYFSTYTDLYNLMKKQFDLSFKFNDIEKVFFAFVNVRSQLKASFQTENRILKEIGFIKQSASYSETPKSFLTISEINPPKVQLTDLQQKIYEMLIDQSERAKKRDLKIVYYMALNIRKKSEKKQVFPIFGALPESNKWIYTPEFIERIAVGKHLYDPGHLNYKGAVLNSMEVLNELKRSQ